MKAPVERNRGVYVLFVFGMGMIWAGGAPVFFVAVDFPYYLKPNLLLVFLGAQKLPHPSLRQQGADTLPEGEQGVDHAFRRSGSLPDLTRCPMNTKLTLVTTNTLFTFQRMSMNTLRVLDFVVFGIQLELVWVHLWRRL